MGDNNGPRVRPSRAKHGWRKIHYGEPVQATLYVRVYRARKPPKPKSLNDNFKANDKDRRYTFIKACRLHLRDLAEVYGYDRISHPIKPVTLTDIMGGDK